MSEKKTKYMSRLTDEVFDSEEEVIEHLKKEGVVEGFELYYDEFEEEELSEIDDTEEEKPEEEGSISEEDLDELKEFKEAVEDYEEFPKEDKDIIFEKVLQYKDYSLPEKKATEFLGELGRDALAKLTNEETWICPFCNKDVRELAKLNNEGFSESAKIAKFLHFKNYHKELYETIVREFIPQKPERNEPPSGELLPHQKGSPNPEACSESEKEELSKEELAEEISKNPDLREQLYRKWIQKKQQREE